MRAEDARAVFRTLSWVFLLVFASSMALVQAGGNVGDTQAWTMHHIDQEPWNHNALSPGDLDRDGDLDIVANAEEHHDGGPGDADPRTHIGVVWFGNRPNER